MSDTPDIKALEKRIETLEEAVKASQRRAISTDLILQMVLQDFWCCKISSSADST